MAQARDLLRDPESNGNSSYQPHLNSPSLTKSSWQLHPPVGNPPRPPNVLKRIPP